MCLRAMANKKHSFCSLLQYQRVLAGFTLHVWPGIPHILLAPPQTLFLLGRHSIIDRAAEKCADYFLH